MWIQLILQVISQNITKHRTGLRMHVEGIQICQINRWNNSFQNMYGMNRQNLTVRPGKSILCKKTPHFRLFWWTRTWVTWLWKDLNTKQLTPDQLLGWPWKLCGITLQTSYVEGWWHQNWAHTSPLHFFTVRTRKFAKKWFWGKALRTHKLSTGRFFGAGTHGILTHSGFRKYSRLGWPSLLFEVIAAQSEVIGQKPVVLQKIRGVTKN